MFHLGLRLILLLFLNDIFTSKKQSWNIFPLVCLFEVRFTIFIPEAGRANSEYSDICMGIKQLFLEMLGVMRTRVSLVSVHSSTTYHFFLIVCANLHAYIVHALSFILPFILMPSIDSLFWGSYSCFFFVLCQS